MVVRDSDSEESPDAPAFVVRDSDADVSPGVPASVAPHPDSEISEKSAPTMIHASRDDLDEDALTSLGEEIMALSERLHAETHDLLRMIAEFDRLEGWRLHGFSSCAEWLAYSTRLDKVTAREKVRVARALAGLPTASAAMERGELSFSQVRAPTRVADVENELDLLEHARSTSASGLERLVRSWRRLGREDETELEQRRFESRGLSIFPDDQGMYMVRGKLDPEAAALVMRAIEAASDALYRGSVPTTTPEQRRADALALMAERDLARGADVSIDSGVAARDSAEAPDQHSGVPDDSPPLSIDSRAAACDSATVSHDSVSEGAHDSAEAPDPSANATGDSAEASSDSAESPASRPDNRRPEPATTCRADRYLVVLHVDSATLDAHQEPRRSELEDGTRVSAETSRRIACDANLLRVGRDRDGSISHVHGKTRTVPLKMRRALEVRDRGCRFPGCGSRFTDAHHIRHWADGGATRLDNLILLCKTHHRLLHEGGFRLEPNARRPERPRFISPRGIPIPEVPPRIIAKHGKSNSACVTSVAPFQRPRWEHDMSVATYLGMLESMT